MKLKFKESKQMDVMKSRDQQIENKKIEWEPMKLKLIFWETQ